MNLEVYSIKDELTEFGSLLLFNNQQAAERAFVDLCRKSFTGKDLSLHHLGYFNTDTGELTVTEKSVIMRGENLDGVQN